MTFKEGKAFITCNPKDPRHYIKSNWIDKGLVDQHLTFTFEDNPRLDDVVKARYREMFSGVFAKRMVYGEWCAAEGLIYPNYLCFTVPENAKIVSLDIGIDYGIASKTAFVSLLAYKDHTNRVRYNICDCLEIDGGAEIINPTDSILADMLYQYISKQRFPVTSVVIDPSSISFRNLLLTDGKRRKFHLRYDRDLPLFYGY